MLANVDSVKPNQQWKADPQRVRLATCEYSLTFQHVCGDDRKRCQLCRMTARERALRFRATARRTWWTRAMYESAQ